MTCREFAILEYMRHGKDNKTATRILKRVELDIPGSAARLDRQATDFDKQTLRECIEFQFTNPQECRALSRMLLAKHRANQ